MMDQQGRLNQQPDCHEKHGGEHVPQRSDQHFDAANQPGFSRDGTNQERAKGQAEFEPNVKLHNTRNWFPSNPEQVNHFKWHAAQQSK